MNWSLRESGSTAPLGQGQLIQQAALLSGLELLAGGDGGLEHQQVLRGAGCPAPGGGGVQLRGHRGQDRQAEQMGTQHHQAHQGKPAPAGAAAAHQAPQAPAHQQLQRRHQTGPAQSGNPCQGLIAGEGGTPQPNPEEGAAGEQHLRQPPQAGGGNRRGGSRGPSPAHQGQPALHQQAPRQAAGSHEHQTERQAEGSRHPDPVEGMEPEQPAVAHQHRRAPPEKPAPAAPLWCPNGN